MPKSSRGGQGAQKKSTPSKLSHSIRQVSSGDDLQKALESNNIKLRNADTIKGQKLHETREAIAGALHVLEEFGATAGIRSVSTYDAGVMAANMFSGELYFNTKYFQPGTRDLVDIMNGGTYHPKNQTAFSTGAHEGGHLLESYLAQKSGMDAWSASDGKLSKQLIRDAANELKRQARAAKQPVPKQAALVAQISGYATKNSKETFAEAVADVVANGKNAHPMSQLIWEGAKKIAGS